MTTEKGLGAILDDIPDDLARNDPALIVNRHDRDIVSSDKSPTVDVLQPSSHAESPPPSAEPHANEANT